MASPKYWIKWIMQQLNKETTELIPKHLVFEIDSRSKS
jgi:hypothetical protein